MGTNRSVEHTVDITPESTTEANAVDLPPWRVNPKPVFAFEDESSKKRAKIDYGEQDLVMSPLHYWWFDVTKGGMACGLLVMFLGGLM